MRRVLVVLCVVLAVSGAVATVVPVPLPVPLPPPVTPVTAVVYLGVFLVGGVVAYIYEVVTNSAGELEATDYEVEYVEAGTEAVVHPPPVEAELAQTGPAFLGAYAGLKSAHGIVDEHDYAALVTDAYLRKMLTMEYYQAERGKFEVPWWVHPVMPEYPFVAVASDVLTDLSGPSLEWLEAEIWHPRLKEYVYDVSGWSETWMRELSLLFLGEMERSLGGTYSLIWDYWLLEDGVAIAFDGEPRSLSGVAGTHDFFSAGTVAGVYRHWGMSWEDMDDWFGVVSTESYWRTRQNTNQSHLAVFVEPSASPRFDQDEWVLRAEPHWLNLRLSNQGLDVEFMGLMPVWDFSTWNTWSFDYQGETLWNAAPGQYYGLQLVPYSVDFEIDWSGYECGEGLPCQGYMNPAWFSITAMVPVVSKFVTESKIYGWDDANSEFVMRLESIESQPHVAFVEMVLPRGVIGLEGISASYDVVTFFVDVGAGGALAHTTKVLEEWWRGIWMKTVLGISAPAVTQVGEEGSVLPWNIVGAPDFGIDVQDGTGAEVWWIVNPMQAIQDAFIPTTSLAARAADLRLELETRFPFSLALGLSFAGTVDGGPLSVPSIPVHDGLIIQPRNQWLNNLGAVTRTAATVLLIASFAVWARGKLTPRTVI